MERRRRIGAYGVARDEHGRVLLVRSSPRSNTPGLWYLPGGGLEHGEHPQDAVVREFREETGLEVVVGAVREATSDVIAFPRRGVLLHHDRLVFDVTVVAGTLTVEAAGTSDLPDWVSPDTGVPLIPFAARALGRTVGTVEITERDGVPDEAGETGLDGRDVGDARRVRRFGAYAVATDPAGRILLSRIAEGYPGGGRWHLPGGGTDFGEQPTEALIREVFEESGQVAAVGTVLAVGAAHNPAALGPERTPLDWHTVRVIYRADVADPTAPVVTEAAGGSTAEARWIDPDELGTFPLTDLAKSQLRHFGH